jgi:hypothetical protein
MVALPDGSAATPRPARALTPELWEMKDVIDMLEAFETSQTCAVQPMRIAFVTIFVFALFVFTWARWGLPKNIDKWKEEGWDINPRIFFLGMKAANEYKSSIATASFLVAGLAFFALVFLQYLGK